MRSRRKSTVRLAADTQYAFALTGPRVRDFKRLATRLDGLVQGSSFNPDSAVKLTGPLIEERNPESSG
jgi:hypothetical protein